MEDETPIFTQELNNFNLKNVNEDNQIFVRVKKEGKKDEEEKKEHIIKYKLNYPILLKELRDKIEEEDDIYNNEFLCNLLLMPSDVEIANKLSIFSCITYLYQLNKKFELIYSVNNKLEKKYMKYINKDNSLYFLNIICRAAYFCKEQSNSFYAYKYILKGNELLNKFKFSENKINATNKHKSKIVEDLKNYIKEKISLFNNEKFIQEEGNKIKELIDLILIFKNNLEIEESASNDDKSKYLYIINKKWILNTKLFISSFLTVLENNTDDIKKLTEQIFDINYVFNSYFNLPIKSDSCILPAYPGPIDNIPITEFKDHWADYKNLDENFFIKKGLKLNEDYILVNYKDWRFLKSVFGATNKILRKKNNLDLMDIKFILFDQRLKIDEENKTLLKQRHIQINQNSTIKQLKYKILNSINNFYEGKYRNFNKKKQRITFSILDKKQNSLLFEFVFAFIKGVDMYESLDIQRLEFNENSSLNDFFQRYDNKKHILIVEIFQVNELPFLFDLKPQNENKYHCNICNKEIDNLDQKYNCICHFSIFCSKKCSTNSDIHRKFEKELKNLVLREFNISNIFEFDIRQILHNYTNLGRAGIDNLENSSYMSSVLQCLSKNEDLTKYFLNQFYLLDKISISSPNSKESFIKAYYDFLNRMFNGREKPINCSEFRDIFINKLKLLKINEQQDSYVFLSNLFNLLHMELNRSNNKEEIKLENCKQKEDETEQEASVRLLKKFKNKDDSIIYDLFQGQYKLTITCKDCGSKSFYFKNFVTLGLPIPSKKSRIQFKLFTNEGRYIKIIAKVDEKTLMSDIVLNSISHIKKSNYFEYLKTTKVKNNLFNYNVSEVPQNILYNNIQIIEFNKWHLITNIYETNYFDINNNNIKNKIIGNKLDNLKYFEYSNKHKNTEIIFFEKSINSLDQNYIDIYAYPVRELKKEGLFGITNYDFIMSYPMIISIRKYNNFKDLKTLIFSKFKKILHSQVQNSFDVIDIYFPHFNDKWENLKTKEGKCPICSKAYDKNINSCSLFHSSFDTNMKISNFIEKINKGKPLVLFVKSEFYDGSQLYDGLKLFSEKKNEIESKSNLTLYDAIDVLNDGEIDTNKWWYCNKCKKEKMSFKKKQIYKPPYYLIIQLQRFKNKGNTKKGLVKNDTLIEYRQSLDLNDFVIGPDKEKSEYTLYGVALHKKTLNGNHNYAYCKSFDDWILYDDTSLESLESLVNKDAYLLFYKRKNFG